MNLNEPKKTTRRTKKPTACSSNPELSEWNLSKLYESSLPIATAKKNDLLSILHLIDPSSREFYVNLRSTENKNIIHFPDIEEFDERMLLIH